jgi:flagellar protein FlaG
MSNEIRSTLDHLLKGGQTPNTDKLTKPVQTILPVKEKAKQETQDNSEVEVINLDDVATKINEHILNVQRDLKFTVSKDTGRTIITVIDSETQEVIRQIPPEELLRLAQALQDTSMNIIKVNV